MKLNQNNLQNGFSSNVFDLKVLHIIHVIVLLKNETSTKIQPAEYKSQ